LWLAAGNGTGAHQVRGLAPDRLLGWSPAADLLAVTAGPLSARTPYGLATTAWLVWPSGSARKLAGGAAIESAAWSPDGGSVALATAGASASELGSYPVTGGRPAVWLKRTASGSVPGGLNYLIDPAGWWPHRGIGFWALADSASLSADQVPFYVISAPGVRPRRLGYTLPGGATDAVAATASGWLAITDEPIGGSGGREIWQGTRVEACALGTAACIAVWPSRSAVTLDPAWSPDGATLAFVRAPSRASPAFSQRVVAAWYRAHRLWLYRPAGHRMRRLDAPGASAPAWSADGRSLLYAATDGIWLLPRPDGRPVRIAHPLFRPGSWPAYYGQVGWAAQFAWWSR
jgi:WD40-like Beta Propeller Repeat